MVLLSFHACTPLREEICDEANRKVFYMCPQCDDKCDFWYLTDSCLASRVSCNYLLGNAHYLIINVCVCVCVGVWVCCGCVYIYVCAYICVCILRSLYSLTTVQRSYLHVSCLYGLCCYLSSGRGNSSNCSSDGACLAMKI